MRHYTSKGFPAYKNPPPPPLRKQSKRKNKSLDYLGLLPDIPDNMEWVFVSYLYANGTRSPKNVLFKDIGYVTYLRQSGHLHHMITESERIIVCGVGFKSKPENKLIRK